MYEITKNSALRPRASNLQCPDPAGATYRGSESFFPVNQTFPPRFDYYRVTFPKWVTLPYLYTIFIEIFDGVEPSTLHSRPQKQYAACDELSTEDGSVMFFYGGHNGATYGINMCAKGKLADGMANVLLRSGIEYSLSRADVCHDFRGIYDAIRPVIATECKSGRMKSTEWGEVHDGSALTRRTLYGGGRTSVYHVVCYEKGLQLGDAYPEDYLRLEHRFQPKSFEKRAYAKLSAVEMIGTHKVARSLALAIADEEIQPFTLDVPYREKDPYNYLLTCCGKTLRRHFEHHGLEEGARIIIADLDELEENRRRRLH